jgi:hypothetical protein
MSQPPPIWTLPYPPMATPAGLADPLSTYTARDPAEQPRQGDRWERVQRDPWTRAVTGRDRIAVVGTDGAGVTYRRVGERPRSCSFGEWAEVVRGAVYLGWGPG